jgi:Trypsin-co-occurring domain 2
VIELASVIRDLRGELQDAIEAGRGEALRFELGPIEWEVTLAVDRTGGGTGKVRFWVLELGGEHQTDTANTQRVKLSLTPRLGESSAGVQVAGDAVPGES